MHREYLSVHDAHCCSRHGCKYGHDWYTGKSCPVVDKLQQGVACESCEYEMNDLQFLEIAYLENEVFTLRKKYHYAVFTLQDAWSLVHNFCTIDSVKQRVRNVFKDIKKLEGFD